MGGVLILASLLVATLTLADITNVYVLLVISVQVLDVDDFEVCGHVERTATATDAKELLQERIERRSVLVILLVAGGRSGGEREEAVIRPFVCVLV